ncbi:MAG: hypothetical protein IKF99_02910 [Oscillospiraceae bacterium]|nr:hypothetical protein [Oscillospiraceae bacterium]
MNLQEYAEAEGLKSAEAIRKRIKAHGRTVKEFTDRKGQLTEEGKATLDAWKLEAEKGTQPDQPTQQDTTANATNRANRAKLEALEAELAAEKAAHAVTLAKLEAITAERDHLLESLRREQDTNSAQAQALIQAQQLHAAALLTDGTERPRRGLFSWLRRKGQPGE